MKLLSQIIKWSSLAVAAGAQLTPFIPADWTIWAALAFGGISALKDGVFLPLGDALDDGKLNNSYNPNK